ncbi:NusA-like transcription termination signal-binding factor [Candidatus Altiarchaeota archaeon]
MHKIRLSRDEIRYIMLFESMTGAKVRDCVESEDMMGFVVNEGDMGLAIGKKGVNIEKVKHSFKKAIWVIEHSEKPDKFIRNMFYPVKIKKVRIKEEENIASIEVSRYDRNKIIGSEGKKIKMARRLLDRHFNLKDLAVKTQ